MFGAGEGADQHEQRGLWQVEVGEERVDELKLVAGAEEDTGLTGVGVQRRAGGHAGAVLEGANGRGAGGDDAAAFAAGAVDGGGGVCGQGVGFGVETDVGEVLDADGLEGAEADVEGDVGDLDTVGADLLEDRGGEVEAGSGRGGGAVGGFAGVDGLVAGAVGGGVGAVQVGRQGDVAEAVEGGEEVAGEGEAEGAFTMIAGFEDRGGEGFRVSRLHHLWCRVGSFVVRVLKGRVFNTYRTGLFCYGCWGLLNKC